MHIYNYLHIHLLICPFDGNIAKLFYIVYKVTLADFFSPAFSTYKECLWMHDEP